VGEVRIKYLPGFSGFPLIDALFRNDLKFSFVKKKMCRTPRTWRRLFFRKLDAPGCGEEKRCYCPLAFIFLKRFNTGCMPAPTPVEQHLMKLAEELELSPLAPKDKSGVFHLPLGPEMKISVKETDEGFSLFSQISPLPVKKREELLMLLMRANYWAGSGREVLDTLFKYPL
jgi:hypothetical protein